MLKINKKLLMVVFVLCVGVGTVVAQTAAANDKPTSYITTWILDDFDDYDKTTVNSGSRIDSVHNVIWDVQGSVYITRTDEKPYPQKAYVNAVPASMSKEFRRDPALMRVLAVQAAFNQKGKNSLELIPTDLNNKIFLDKEGNPLPGVFFSDEIMGVGLYVLGVLRNYSISATFETAAGRAFSVYLGDLNYKGWKALSAEVPIGEYITDAERINASYIARLVNFTIKTRVDERVDDFLVYFDNMYYTRALSQEQYYDGYDLTLSEYRFGNKADGTPNIQWENGSIATQ